MSTAAIRRQEKNQLGDRPIYGGRDRIEVLSALRPVDRVVMLDDLDCLPALRAFCPDYFIKSTHDLSHAVVQAEAALVQGLGGRTIHLTDHHPGYSFTTIIQHVRQQCETRAAEFAEHNSAASSDNWR